MALKKKPVPPRAKEGVERTMHRLVWYKNGLEETPTGFSGRIFVGGHRERRALMERIQREMRPLEKARRRAR